MLPHPPTAQWLRDVLSCLDLEKMCYSVSNSNKKFQKYFQSKLICPFLVCFVFVCFLSVIQSVPVSLVIYLSCYLYLPWKTKPDFLSCNTPGATFFCPCGFCLVEREGMFEIRLHKMLLSHRFLLCKLVLYVWHSATLQSVYVVWKCKQMYLEMQYTYIRENVCEASILI